MECWTSNFFEKNFFHNFFANFFVPKFILSDVDYFSTDFSIPGWGQAELRLAELSHFSEIFDFLNLIMHIGGPLSFRLAKYAITLPQKRVPV